MQWGTHFLQVNKTVNFRTWMALSHLPVAPSVHAVVPQVVVGRQDRQVGVEGRPGVPVHVLHDQPRPGDQEPVADAEGAAGGGRVAGGEATLLPGSADIPRKGKTSFFCICFPKLRDKETRAVGG